MTYQRLRLHSILQCEMGSKNGKANPILLDRSDEICQDLVELLWMLPEHHMPPQHCGLGLGEVLLHKGYCRVSSMLGNDAKGGQCFIHQAQRPGDQAP